MRSRCALALAVTAAALALAGCGADEEPLTIGVLTDCSGLLGASKELYLAGAALPLVERGGERTGDYGVRAVEIAGLPVEVVPACTEVTYFHLLVFGARRLVEEHGADIVVGPIGTPESVAFREIASRYPDVTFVSGVSAAQEPTLRDLQPNLFRFLPDGPQIAAGLGTYAYEDLGWRRATIVAEPFADAFELAAGFVAEFCALGGSVERDWASVLAPDPAAAAARHASGSDGVVLIVDFFSPLPYLTGYARHVGRDVSRRLLLVGGVFYDPANLEPQGANLDGTIVGGYIPLDARVSSMRRFRERFAKAFPELSYAPGFVPVIVPATAAMEAIVSALERVDGDLGTRQRAFRDALAATDIRAPFGRLQLDANRQAEVSSYLQRVVHTRGGVGAELFRRIPGVTQSYGGIFTSTTPSPSFDQPSCERRTPPPWAR